MSDIFYMSGFTGPLSKAGLACGTAGATIDVAAPNGAGVDFAINGVAYHKADAASIAVTAHAAQADLTSCLYLVQLNSSGTVSTKKGNEEVTGSGMVLHWPMPDASRCPIGGYRVDMSGATYTNGTTELDAGTVTDTYFDFALGMPVKPEIA